MFFGLAVARCFYPDSFRRAKYVHMNMTNIFGVYGHGYGTNSLVNRNSWSSTYGRGPQDVESSSLSNSRHSFQRANSNRTGEGRAFHAMEV
jgi:hypothetical protein